MVPSRHSQLIKAALLLGASGALFCSASLQAGDKIEFSAPTASLNQPESMQEKDRSQTFGPLSGLGSKDRFDLAPPPMPVMVIMPGGRARKDASSTDNPGESGSTHSSYSRQQFGVQTGEMEGLSARFSPFSDMDTAVSRKSESLSSRSRPGLKDVLGESTSSGRNHDDSGLLRQDTTSLGLSRSGSDVLGSQPSASRPAREDILNPAMGSGSRQDLDFNSSKQQQPWAVSRATGSRSDDFHSARPMAPSMSGSQGSAPVIAAPVRRETRSVLDAPRRPGDIFSTGN